MENRFGVCLIFAFSPFPASLFRKVFALQQFSISVFLARHDQYFMFVDSNVFKFTNFPFKTKYYNIATYYLFSRRKQEKKLLKQFFDQIYYVFINVPPKLDDF